MGSESLRRSLFFTAVTISGSTNTLSTVHGIPLPQCAGFRINEVMLRQLQLHLPSLLFHRLARFHRAAHLQLQATIDVYDMVCLMSVASLQVQIQARSGPAISLAHWIAVTRAVLAKYKAQLFSFPVNVIPLFRYPIFEKSLIFSLVAKSSSSK